MKNQTIMTRSLVLIVFPFNRSIISACHYWKMGSPQPVPILQIHNLKFLSLIHWSNRRVRKQMVSSGKIQVPIRTHDESLLMVPF